MKGVKRSAHPGQNNALKCSAIEERTESFQLTRQFEIFHRVFQRFRLPQNIPQITAFDHFEVSSHFISAVEIIETGIRALACSDTLVPDRDSSPRRNCPNSRRGWGPMGK